MAAYEPSPKKKLQASRDLHITHLVGEPISTTGLLKPDEPSRSLGIQAIQDDMPGLFDYALQVSFVQKVVKKLVSRINRDGINATLNDLKSRKFISFAEWLTEWSTRADDYNNAQALATCLVTIYNNATSLLLI